MKAWLTAAEALAYCKQYNKGPKNNASLQWAGKKAGFIRKAADGFHWEYEGEKLRRYMKIANYQTMNDIAKICETTSGNLRYIALEYGIHFHHDLGRKYLTPSDAIKLMTIYQETHHVKK